MFIAFSFPQVVRAGWFSEFFDDFFDAVGNAARSVYKAVSAAVNVVINIAVATTEVITGSVFGSSWLKGDGSCRWENLTEDVFDSYNGECDGVISGAGGGVGGTGVGVSSSGSSGDGTSIIGSSEVGGCAYEIPLTFYIPFYGEGYQEVITYYNGYEESPKTLPAGTQRYKPRQFGGDETNCSVPDPNGGYAKAQASTWWGSQEQCVKISASCNQTSIIEGDKIAIYRFTLPGDSTNLNSWFLDSIKNQVGDGFLDVFTNAYWSVPDSEPIAIFPSSQICSGNVCQIKDASAPENSYLVYAAKIIGSYTAKGENLTSGDGPTIFACPSNSNKFLKKDNPGGGVVVPDAYSSTGNMFNGVYKTEACPPKVDLKLNDRDESYNITYPRTDVILKWTSRKAKDLIVASTNTNNLWSGFKSVFGTETLGKLTRGTSNPGQGKKYDFSISGKSIIDNSTLTDSVSVTVFRYPECEFKADPAVIEVLPATSTLSWDCRYYGVPDSSADSCKIDQGIGEVNSEFGFKDIRPTKKTTYTLTCDSLDGSQSYQASVNIGFKPRVYEVIPSY